MHNTRIERLWVDMKAQATTRWTEVFRDLEDNHGLDINNDNHIWLLHILFLPQINRDLSRFRDGWNNHLIRRQGRSQKSPAELFVMGMYERGVRGYRLPEHGNISDGLCLTDASIPPHLNNVEVNPPGWNDARRFLLGRIMNRLARSPTRDPAETWNEAVVDCRMDYSDDF